MTRYIAIWAATILAALFALITQLAMVVHRPVPSLPVLVEPSGKVALAPADVPNVVESPDSRHVADCLVEAVVQVESGGDARKVGRAGERGVMQIKRTTWRSVTRRLFGAPLPFDRAFEPELNRRVGKAYLAEIQAFLQQNRNLWRADERSLLLACYNAGPTRVMEARFEIRRLPASTRSYIERATALHEFYLAEDAAKIRKLLLAQGGLLPRSPVGS